MVRQASASSAPTGPWRWWWLPPQGLGVGLLIGIAGVGWGFAVVPALVLLGRLPMSLDSGTSLLVIAAGSLMELLSHGEWSVEGFRLLFPLLIGGGFGFLLGQRLGSHLPEQRLRQGFAALLLVSEVSSGIEALQPRDAHAVQPPVLNEPSTTSLMWSMRMAEILFATSPLGAGLFC